MQPVAAEGGGLVRGAAYGTCMQPPSKKKLYLMRLIKTLNEINELLIL